MKTPLQLAALALLLSTILYQPSTALAQGSRYFRISGPAATTITSFNPDGTLVWSNALTGSNYTVQTVTSLPGGTNWVDYVQIPAANNVNTNRLIAFNAPAGMALIPAGSFTMGDNLDGESDAVPTNVYVSAFYMDTNLVNSNQWWSVYNWATNYGYGFVHAGSAKAADHPVQSVDWYDCVKWSNARSQQAGLTPVYYTDAGMTQIYMNGEGIDTNGDPVAPYANWAANGYRLPTEAEWEKAARGGLSGQRFPWGNVITENLANYFGRTASYSYDLGPNSYNVNFSQQAYPYTSPVGYFAANGYGLYDMAGNVFEWCWDWYGNPYGQPTTTNPTGPATGNNRMLRGGRWNGSADSARCASRNGDIPPYYDFSYGFRCVRRL